MLGEPAGSPSDLHYLFRTILLWTVNPFTVGFTQGTGAKAGPSCVQSGAAAAPAATARARKNVPARALNVNAPFAAALARPIDLRLPDLAPPKILTVVPPLG